MNKEKDCRVLEFRTGSGQVLFSLWLIEKEEAYPEPPKPEEKSTKEKGGKGENQQKNKNEEKSKGNPAPDESLMTDAQKRYLFRLLAEQGLEGEKAHEELKKVFGVDSLKKATKFEASREIERRLEIQKGGGQNG